MDIKVFWPSHLCSPKSKQGYLIGWFNTFGTLCVASIISDVKLSELEDILLEFCLSGEHDEFTHINRVCNVQPQILGVYTIRNQPHHLTHTHPADYPIWLHIDMNEAYVPIPMHMTLKNQPVDILSYEIIFYDQPNPERLQFLALNPLELDISTSKISKPVLTKVEQEASLNLKKIMEYGNVLNGETDQKSDDLGKILIQINSSYFLEHGIQLLKMNHQRRDTRYPTFYAISNIVTSILNSIVKTIILSPKGFIGYYIRKIVVGLFLSILFLALNMAEVTLHLLTMRLPKFILNGVAVKDLFAGAQQIDLRLQQLFFWPRQYMMLRKRNWANTAKTRAYYISFYNSMWLVANDIIIGLAIGSFLMANHQILAIKLHGILHKYTVKSLQSMMFWFLESPAGLKLNHELGSFLSELFLWLFRLWTLCIQAIEPYTPRIIRIIGVSGIFGVTMVISLSSDFLALMTLHVYCFYMVAARIFNWQLVILNSLFNLFRGKKRNVLRNRIDSCDYDLDQLLLGTSLFTLLTFLFPTVVIYYATFALSRVGVIILQAIMETILAFFNHFPLFAIMLRIKDPERLPGGLEFQIFNDEDFLLKHHGIAYKIKKMWIKLTAKKPQKSHSKFTKKPVKYKKFVTFNMTHQVKRRKPIHLATATQPKKGTYLWMHNLPIPLSAIFFQYMLLWKRLSSHYFSAYVFKSLLYGEPIKPIPKLQVRRNGDYISNASR
ncbi:N-acetylglucosaminyl transferase component-domain-containing protein [Pilobolus umbonatus]|nr:N-acetylglucosaminyl transferase component-domain-containing protein [Pilobolus umbonatus]